MPLLAHLGFHTVLIDARQELVNDVIFPSAQERYSFPYSEISNHLNITEQDYVIVMTHTHQHDFTVLEEILPANPFYIGVMGSRKKIQFLTESLQKKGFSLEQIQRCHMPIGLDISAETPAEIAVSVLAEIIAYRAANL